MIYRLCFLRTLLCLFVVLTPVWSWAELSETVDIKAVEILNQMNDYLSSLQTIGFVAIESEEEVSDDGQKLMFENAIRFEMARPNRFYVRSQNGERDLEMFYDNSTFTIYNNNLNFYSTTNAPPTINETFTKLDTELNIQIVARDILRDDSSKFLLASINAGFVVGDALAAGALCTHLAFRLTDTDMQIWIKKGEQPLPMKYVVTSRWITGAPQYTVSFFDWVASEYIKNEHFIFKAPKDAKEISFMAVAAQKEVSK